MQVHKYKYLPAGSPVLRPELLGDNFRPGEASLLAAGVRPNRPAARKRAVDVQMICTNARAQVSALNQDKLCTLEQENGIADGI